MNCRLAREELAASLLTHEPLDREVATHLSNCPGCAAEAAALRPVVGLLGGIDPVPAGPDTRDDDFLDRLLREAARRRTSRLRRIALGSLAAAAAVLIVIGAAVSARIEAPPPTTQATASESGIKATVNAASAAAGSELAATLSGIAPGTHCILRVNNDGGGPPEIAADWRAKYDGTAHVTGEVAAPADTITSVQLVDGTNGRVLLTVPFT